MNNDGPCIDNGWVVWSSGGHWGRPGYRPFVSYQIYAYNIDSGETIQITNNVAGNFSPSIEGSNGGMGDQGSQRHHDLRHRLATIARSRRSLWRV